MFDPNPHTGSTTCLSCQARTHSIIPRRGSSDVTRSNEPAAPLFVPSNLLRKEEAQATTDACQAGYKLLDNASHEEEKEEREGTSCT
jgi:hypothetical protein